MQDINIITLSQDKGNSSNGFNKITVIIPEPNLIQAIKQRFKWRTNVTVKRLYSDVSTSDYDAFIQALPVKYRK